RGGGSPTVSRGERSPLLRPQRLAIHIKTKQTHVAEVSIDALTVSHRSFRCIAVLQVARTVGRALLHFLLPANLACLEVHAVDRPRVNVSRRFAFAAEIQTLLGRFARDRAYDRSHKNAVAPDGRRTPAGPGDVGFPRDVFGGAPLIREVCIFGDTERTGSAKLRPVTLSHRASQKQRDKRESG